MVPQLLLLNHEHPGQRGVPHSGTLSSRICRPFPENTPQGSQKQERDPKRPGSSDFHNPQVRCLISFFNIKPQNSFRLTIQGPQVEPHAGIPRATN